MKKIISLVLAVVMIFASCLIFASCGKSAYTIGIVQLAPHPALDAATQGFQDAVKEKLGADNVTFDLQNAAGESNTCTTIVNSFVSKKVDLIMANATPALTAAYNATETIPILGTSITEYGTALNIANFNGTVGGNCSGTSDLAPLDKQAQMIIDLFPNAKKVGLLYCSAEPNSLYQVKVVKEYLEAKGLTVTNFSFSDSNDLRTITERAADQSDVIYIPTDNTAATGAEIIGGILSQKKVPAIAGEESICKGCAVATLSISYYDLGYKTGLMAAEILKDGKDISKMPIQYVDTFTKKYNKKMATELGIDIPSDYVEIAD